MTLCAMGLAACAGSPSPSASGTADATPLPIDVVVSATPDATPSPAAPVGWRLLTPEGQAPPAREDHTWTVAADGTTAFLFGGRDTAGRAFDDLWAYDLATDSWRQVETVGPPARFGHNAAWVDNVGLVVFAGQSPTTFYNDLWAYDPAADRWRELPAGGDAPGRPLRELRGDRAGRPAVDQPRLHQRGFALRRHARLRLHHARMVR